MKLIILPYAEKDIKETILYYIDNYEGLEKEFIRIIDSSFNEITKNPEIFPIVKYDIRKFVVRKFSFCIYFIS